MTDPSDPIDSVESEDTQPLKKKMSDAKKAALDKAREKAYAKRKELGEIRQQELALDKRIKEKELVVRKKRLEKAIAVMSDSDDSYEAYRNRKKGQRARQLARTPASPTAVSQPAVSQPLDLHAIPREELTAAIARDELRRRVQVDSERIAWASLFPGHDFPS